MKIITITDAQRHRWDVNLTRKNRCKKIREISLILGAAALLLTLLHLIFALPAAASGNRRVQIAVIACALMCITLAPGIWKQYLPLMIACAVLFLCCTVIEGDLFHPLVPPALAAAYYARREDLLLRNEEGYPDFDIDRLIRMQNAQAEESIRAHEAQLRREPPSDMLPL